MVLLTLCLVWTVRCHGFLILFDWSSFYYGLHFIKACQCPPTDTWNNRLATVASSIHLLNMDIESSYGCVHVLLYLQMISAIFFFLSSGMGSVFGHRHHSCSEQWEVVTDKQSFRHTYPGVWMTACVDFEGRCLQSICWAEPDHRFVDAIRCDYRERKKPHWFRFVRC